MNRFTTALLTVAMTSAATLPVSGAQFILEVDDASHVKLETGAYASAYKEVTIQNGANTITLSGSDDCFLTPREGFLIESVTAYDQSGAEDTSAKKWSYDSNDDSYKIYFLGSQTPAYKYVVKTKVDNSPVYTLTFDINDPSAVKGGTFKVGNQTITPVIGQQTIKYNPDKGIQFYMQLRPAVTEVTFLRNGTAVNPAGTMADGTRTYKFNLSDNDNIDIDVVMEKTEFFLDIDDPSHIEVCFPNASSLLDGLVAGRNKLSYAYDDRLIIKAKDGYRITGLDNMSYNSNSEEYSYTFSDGDSGVTFNIVTEEYTPPMAYFTLNLLNPEIMSYIQLPNDNVRDFIVGDTEFSLNLDKKSNLPLYYSSKYEGKVMATFDGELLAMKEYWGGFYSDITGIEPGNHRIVVREIIEGEYPGTVVYASSDNCTEWTLTFDPAGIIEKVDGVAMPAISSDSRASVMATEVAVAENTATITFDGTIDTGSYTLNVPAGLFKINGATSGALSHNFQVVMSGIDTINSEETSVRYFNLQGVEVSNPAEGEIVIEVKGDKARKTIFKN